MHLARYIKIILLITLLSLVFGSGVNAKPASGLENLVAAPHQGETLFNPLMHQEKTDVSTIDMSGYPLGPKGGKSLYHYTDDVGLEGILKTKKLNASTKANSLKDARYGDGQYLSDIVPGSKTNGQLSKSFLNIPWQGKKFKNYVEIDVSRLNVVKGRDGVFVIPNSGSLDISKRIIGSGRN